MDAKIFNAFRELIYAASGITLNEKKEALVSARIAKRMRVLNLESQSAYLRHVTEDDSGEEMVQLLDVISTNVTHFYREEHHFQLVSQLLESWRSQGQSRFRIWSAGCSSGEEPYTLAITIKEALNGGTADARILATDISTRILHKAIEGAYDKKKIDNVPGMLRDKYFHKAGRLEAATYSVTNDLRNMILFRRLNLSVVPFPMQGPMDIIFCRNVMIYFDNNVRANLLKEFHRLLKPGGYLMVGHAESLTGILCGLKSVQPSVYAKA
ncbi:MAG: methyltransferase domain-containing protein [Chitinivibrionales bacterium]|nr:methyltransferase domain-containing protein [Chitinivibrionales bacterium]